MHHYANAASGWHTTAATAVSGVFFAEFDGIVDAELATGMNHDRVRRLIMDTAAANGSAAIAAARLRHRRRRRRGPLVAQPAIASTPSVSETD
ncbi:MAG: hypothetical protein GY835_11700 [bacterium]|nr:hypothetical protein [bacterium]